MSDIGSYIKKKRESVGYSQKKLASLSGISDSELLKIEKGDRQNPNGKYLSDIAKALGISPFELFLEAGYIEQSDMPQELPIKRIDKLLEAEIELVQLYIDFLIAKRSGLLRKAGEGNDF